MNRSRPEAPAPADPAAAPQSHGHADHAGSGNTLGDGRTAGGAQNVRKRETLSLPAKKKDKRPPG
jgi:hypothetical protein